MPEIASLLATADVETSDAERSLERLSNKIDGMGNRLRDASGRFVSVKGAADSATASLNKQGNQVEQLTSKLDKLENVTRRIGLSMTVAVTAPITAAIAAIIKIGSSTETALNRLQGTSQATASQMEAVRAKATELGRDLTLPNTSARNAALAMLELSKGGLSVEQSMQAARGTIQLAKAALIDEQQAAVITSDALNTFGLSGENAVRVADLLAGSASASSGEVTDMASALAQAGAVAKGAGVSIEDAVTAISLLAKNGVKGSDAGTSLKTFLLALQTPISDGAANALKKLNIEAYNTQTGALKSLPTLIGEFKAKLATLDDKSQAGFLKEVFGSDAIRAARILFGEGTEGFKKMSAAVTRSGQAAEQAAASTRGLEGAWGGLMSVLETAAGSIFEDMKAPLTSIVGKLTEAASFLADLWDSLTPQGKLAVGVFVALAAAIGPVLLGISAMAATATLLAPFIGLALQITAAVAGIGVVIAGVALAWQQNLGGIQEIAAHVWDAVSSIFLDAYDYIKNRVMAIVNVVTACWDAIKDTVTPAWEAIKYIIFAALTFITDRFKIIVGLITFDWQKVWDGVVDIVKTVPVLLLKALGKIIEALANFIGLALKAAWEIGKAIVLGIWGGLNDLGFFILDRLKEIPAAVGRAAKWAYEACVKLAKEMYQGIVDGLEALWSWFTTGFTDKLTAGINGAKDRANAEAASLGSGMAHSLWDSFEAVPPPQINMPFVKGDAPAHFDPTGGLGNMLRAGQQAAGAKKSANFGGGGGGGGKGGGGKSAAEQMAEAAVKTAEINLKGVERINAEAASSFKRLFDKNQIALKAFNDEQITEETRAYNAKLALNQSKTAEANLIKNATERNSRIKELNEELLQLESDHKQKLKDINLASLDEQATTLTARMDVIYSIHQEKLRAQTDLVNSAAMQRVMTAEQTARTLGQIQLSALNESENKVRDNLATMREGSEGYKREYMKLGVLEVQRAYLIEETNRKIAEGRKKDLDDLSQYFDKVRSLEFENLQLGESIGRARLERLKNLGILSTENYKREIARQDEQAEIQRAKQERADIIAAQASVDISKRSAEERQKYEDSYRERLELAEVSHQDKLREIRERPLIELREKLEKLANQMVGIFKNALNGYKEGGLKGFFKSLISDFRDVLEQWAMDLLKARVFKLLQQLNPKFSAAAQGEGQSAGAATTPGFNGGNIFSQLLHAVGLGGGQPVVANGQQPSGAIDQAGRSMTGAIKSAGAESKRGVDDAGKAQSGTLMTVGQGIVSTMLQIGSMLANANARGGFWSGLFAAAAVGAINGGVGAWTGASGSVNSPGGGGGSGNGGKGAPKTPGGPTQPQLAMGGMIQAMMGGKLIQVAEGGFDELVLTTDPKHRSRTEALISDFIKRTGITPQISGAFASGGFVDKGPGYVSPSVFPSLRTGAARAVSGAGDNRSYNFHFNVSVDGGTGTPQERYRTGRQIAREAAGHLQSHIRN
jgi:TP901 family phage tail tape measure protein